MEEKIGHMSQIGLIGLIGLIKKYIWSVLIVGFVLFSLAPTFYELARSGDLPPNREFELVHNFPTDYNFYLSRIREGMEGRWTVVEKYTSESHPGSFIHEMYLLMGQVGRQLRIPLGRAADIYHVGRIVLAVALLAMIAEFCKTSFSKTTALVANKNLGPSSVSSAHAPYVRSLKESEAGQNFVRSPQQWLWSLLAYLLAVTASSWPKLVYVDGVVRLGGYMPWWSVVDSLQRITFIPHLLAGQILIIFLIGSLTSPRVLRSGGNVVFLGLLGFLLGMIFPPGLIFVYAVMGAHVILNMTYRTNKTDKANMIVRYVGFVCVSAPAIVYLLLMTSVYPWKRLAEFDTIHPLPFDYVEYFKAIGPMGPIGLIGLIWALFRKEKAVFAAVSWVLAWLGCLGIFHFIPSQSPLRFSEMLPNVPLGILGVYIFFELSHLRNLRYLSHLMIIFLIVLGLFHMYSSWLWQRDFVDHKVRAGLPLVPTGSYVMYPLKDFISAIGFIQDNTTGDQVVLSETTAGNYIPVIAGNTVYVGHDNTVNAEEKKQDVRVFFAGQMTPAVAEEFIRTTRASLIYFGPQEREDGGVSDLNKPYPFLKSVYKNSYVTVYAAP